jgi:hypothetical protein
MWHVREQQVGGAEIIARAVEAMVCVSFLANSLNRSERSTGRWRGMWDCAKGNHRCAFDFGPSRRRGGARSRGCLKSNLFWQLWHVAKFFSLHY